jgi:vacuolar-type H+-ATPase subunit H
MESLLQAIKRVERKLDTVIRAIYEHDEDIQDEYGRSQRTIDAGHRDKAEDQAGDLLGECDESSLRECNVPDVQREEEPRAPIANRSSEREANPPRDNGKVQREEPIPRSNGKNKNVPRENGASKHASSKPNATRQHHSRGNRQRGSNGNTQGANR